MNYQYELYEHYHDNGDDAPPTIEHAVICLRTNTYITGYESELEAKKGAQKLNNLDEIYKQNDRGYYV